MPVQHGAFVEPLACIVAAVENAELPMGATALLTGAGPMGLLTLQLAHRSRAAQVIVSEPNPVRRALALRLGADQVVDPRDGQVEATVAAATGVPASKLPSIAPVFRPRWPIAYSRSQTAAGW